MSQYVFVSSCYNWADEFDVHGMFVCEQEWIDKILVEVKKYFDKDGEKIECYFGTNECITFDSYEAVTEGLHINECSAEFHDEFIRLHRGFRFSGNLFIDKFIEMMPEDEDSD